MPRALIVSSHVATSPVGGGAQMAVLARIGVETILVPTVLFGRHPGLGAPGGGAVPTELFEGMIQGVEASGALKGVDAVITGYFANARQVVAGARLIDAVRAARPTAWIVVDPIMGDRAAGRYVAEEVAAALAKDLIPLADLVAPNAWELEQLSGQNISGAASALIAARSLRRPALVSSIAAGGKIGVLYVDAQDAWLATHALQNVDPKGAGDMLTALFVGAVLGGATPRDALRRSVKMTAAHVVGGAPAVRVTTV